MTTITRDLGYYNAAWTHDGGTTTTGIDYLADPDTGSEVLLSVTSDSIDGGHYGVGPDFINFPTDIPSGYTLTSGRYVVIAYTEAGDTIPADTSTWGYTPAPLTEPFLLALGNGTFNALDGLPVGGYDGETLQRASDPRLFSDGPAGHWRIAENLYDGTPAPHIHVAYVAIRLFYDNGAVDLPCDTDVSLDLSTAVQMGTPDSGLSTLPAFGQYIDGVICSDTDAGNPYFPSFYFPGLTLDATKSYRVTITYDPDSPHDDGTSVGRETFIGGLRPGHETEDEALAPDTADVAWQDMTSRFVDAFADGILTLADTDTPKDGGGLADVQVCTIGPAVTVDTWPAWSDATVGVVAGYTVPWFVTHRRGAVSSITIRKLCTFGIPWLRLTNRDELRGSGRRSIQGSNRLTGYA